MAYITKRVIAMGFPSTGCETLYRNSLKDITNFFHKYHNDNVKIYNLCLEKDRIYNKSIFNKCEVGLFPATDHNPCPIKLILEFCIDICKWSTSVSDFSQKDIIDSKDDVKDAITSVFINVEELLGTENAFIDQFAIQYRVLEQQIIQGAKDIKEQEEILNRYQEQVNSLSSNEIGIM